LFKTSKGKYVAPAPIEDLLAQHPDVEACVVTGANFSQPFALLLLSAAALERRRTEAGRKALEQSLQALLQTVNVQLDAHERLDMLVVVAETWTAENGMVTPTLKVKRPRMEEVYSVRYTRWLEHKRPVVWAHPIDAHPAR
jgi:long-chain acyl-CoA synthetase